jgi:hypothetical protein
MPNKDTTNPKQFNYEALEDAWTKSKVSVLDAMPGSGKTTAITQYLKNQKINHVLFVSPFKSEVEEELPKRKLKGLNYAHPTSGQGGKVTQLNKLIRFGDDSTGNRLHRITCTHSAFTRLSSEIFDQLGNYTIIIDETLDVITQLDELRQYSDRMLLNSGIVNPDNKLYQFNDKSWFDAVHSSDIEVFNETGDGYKDTMFRLCQMASMNQLYRYSEGNWFRMLPIALITKAKRVIVMTHGFENSFMHCWLKLHGVEHSYIDNTKLGLVSEVNLKRNLSKNLQFIDIPRTIQALSEGRRGYESLSVAHWKALKKAGKISDIAKSLNNLVKEKMDAQKTNVFWTCPKSFRADIETNAYRLKGKITLEAPLEIADTESDDISELDNQKGTEHSSWLPCNIKARNDFRHITNCLYAFSLNPPPAILNILEATSGLKKAEIEATFKLNNLLQFIFRGSIRENKPMKLCIVPQTTRALLDGFLKTH